MKMKIITTALIVGALSNSALADDGKINFVGSITDDTCTVTNNVSSPLTVTLGTVSSSAFSGAGSTAAPTKFTISLAACPESMTSAKVKFDGTADANVDSVLALTQVTGVAKNVGIQIKDKTNAVVPLHQASAAYALTEGNNNLDFVANYYATSSAVTAGTANATSNFTIVYN